MQLLIKKWIRYFFGFKIWHVWWVFLEQKNLLSIFRDVKIKPIQFLYIEIHLKIGGFRLASNVIFPIFQTLSVWFASKLQYCFSWAKSCNRYWSNARSVFERLQIKYWICFYHIFRISDLDIFSEILHTMELNTAGKTAKLFIRGFKW